MVKAFEQRQFELEKMKARRQEPEILQRNSNNQEQREQTRYGKSNVEGISPKRPRTQVRIVDRMHNGEHRSQKKQTLPDQADLEDRSRKIATVNPNNGDLENGNLSFPTASNPYPNKLHTSRYFKKSSPELDNASPCDKYSKKVGLGPPWRKPLLYPKIGKKKTIVEWSDLERLDEGEFLNDNIIGFYLHFLEKNWKIFSMGLLRGFTFLIPFSSQA